MHLPFSHVFSTTVVRFLKPKLGWLTLSQLTLLSALVLALGLSVTSAHAKRKKVSAPPTTSSPPAYPAETLLIDIYKMIGAGKAREGLNLAQRLATDYPHFQLGQLVYGDLLNMQTKPVQALGDVALSGININKNGSTQALSELREESGLRLKALRDRPAPNTLPSQLLALSARNRHVIAVDTSKSRLYLFENSGSDTKLIADYYIAVGKAGVGKHVEGDLKTPLGLYFLNTPIDPKKLAPLYGGGALPINYPNPLDLRLGRTGSGIWLHGSPPDRYARQPKSTDGCVVLSNPDLRNVMNTVAVKSTPVIIASQLQWVNAAQTQSNRKPFETAWNAWRQAKNSAQTDQLYGFYMPDFSNYGRNLKNWWPNVLNEVRQSNGQGFQWKAISMLSWTGDGTSQNPSVVVVTFDEAPAPNRRFVTKRQYWMQASNSTSNQWKMFFEGSISQ